jgi:hypothetical protein
MLAYVSNRLVNSGYQKKLRRSPIHGERVAVTFVLSTFQTLDMLMFKTLMFIVVTEELVNELI